MKPTSQLARTVFVAQLAALADNEPCARVGDDAEAVHRMRVATRRLRAALRVFSPPDAERLRTELAWLAAALGAVRDLDVQMASIERMALPGEAISPLLERMQAAQHVARADLLAALDTPRYQSLCAALRDLEPPPHGDPASFVRAAMRRFLKAAAHIDTNVPPERLHRARIRAKQLRYTLEFVAELYDKPARSLIRRVVAVQDVLGTIQDSYVMQCRLEELRAELPPTSTLVIHRLQGAYAQQAELARTAVQPAIRKVLGKRWRRLDRAMASSRRARKPPAHQGSQLRPFHTAVNGA